MLLGVLTGGGDVPGLNPCIKAFVNRAQRVTGCSGSAGAGRAS